MHKLQEPTVILRCRKEDLLIVEKQMEPARKQYADLYHCEAPSITLDKISFLAPGPKLGSDSASW